MKLVCAALAATAAAASEAKAELSSFARIAEFVNAQNAGWTAEVPTRFGSVEDVRRVCGTVLAGNASYRVMDWQKTHDEAWSDDVPSEFDVRAKWPKCASVSGHIRDQSDCGSCWAFASTEAFNDRRCIATGDTTLLSAEDTVANCGILRCFSMGCNGGQPGEAWSWFKSTGVVTGGDYDDTGKGDTCAPYSIAPCAHHVTPTAKYPKCPSGLEPTPRIGAHCTEKGYTKSYAQDKKRASSSYGLHSVRGIQQDILRYGSATAAFSVYADFPTYKSGVYSHTTGSSLGGHAVKLLGWGTEAGQDYWLVANSWNEQWGDHGTFKIKRGSDECGIESQVVAGTVGGADETTLVV